MTVNDCNTCVWRWRNKCDRVTSGDDAVTAWRRSVQRIRGFGHNGLPVGTPETSCPSWRERYSGRVGQLLLRASDAPLSARDIIDRAGHPTRLSKVLVRELIMAAPEVANCTDGDLTFLLAQSGRVFAVIVEREPSEPYEEPHYYDECFTFCEIDVARLALCLEATP